MSMNHLLKVYDLNLGEHRGNKRVWLESKKINETLLASSMSYAIEVDMEAKRISLVKGNDRSITSRKNGRSVIDLNNATITEIFKGYTQVTVKIHSDSIVIEPLAEELKQEEARSKAFTKTPTLLEIFAGGSTLTTALRDAGVKPVGMVELEDKYLENAETNHPNVFSYCGDLAKLDISLLPKADIVCGGIPCEGYSQSQLGMNRKEAHPTGSLGFYFLKIVDAIRPAMVLIEEVPNFGNSAMAAMVRYVLLAMNYKISEQILSGSDFGSLTKRKRYVMVASIKEAFDFNALSFSSCTKTVNDILEVATEKREWQTAQNNASVATMFRREKEHKAKGNGFKMGAVLPDSNLVPTITKGIYKCRLTDPILVNPVNTNELSWFTPRELARINGLPESFILPESKTTAGEIIGQGVCYNVFYELGKAMVAMFQKEPKQEQEAFPTNDALYGSRELQAFATGVLFA